MKKGIKTLAAAALAVSALTPVAAASAAASSIADGVYTTSDYYTLAEFKKLSTAGKSSALMSADAVVVIGGQAYKATDVLTATDAQLPTLGTAADTYTTATGDKLVSGQKIGAESGSVVTENFTLKVTPVNAQVSANGADNTVIKFELLNADGVLDTNADNLVLEIGTTFGNLATKRVTVQDGVGQVVLSSEFSSKEVVAKVTAQVIEASADYKNLIGKIAGETTVTFTPASITTDPNAVTFQDAESNQADRVVLYFDKPVGAATFVKTNKDGEFLTTADKKEQILKDVVTINVSQKGEAKKVVGIVPVEGNDKAVEVLLDKSTILTDNAKVDLDVKIGTTRNQRSFTLTDARQPEFTGVTATNLRTLELKFSESVANGNFSIDGIWNAGTHFDVTLGDFNAVTGKDNRDTATVTLNNLGGTTGQLYFEAGTHSITVTQLKDFAALSDNANISTTQTLNFKVAADTAAPTAQVTVESPEQFRVTFNKDVESTEDLNALFNDALKVYDETTKQWVSIAGPAFDKTDFLVVEQVSATEFVVELNEDWTNILAEETDAYYNYKFKFEFDKDVFTSVTNGIKNAKFDLDLNYAGSALNAADNNSPVIADITQTANHSVYEITMNEPVKLPGKDNSGDTLGKNQVNLPTVYAEFQGKDKDGKAVVIPATVSNYSDTNKADKKFTVSTTDAQALQSLVNKEGYSENWTVVVRSISDDIGNTAATLTKDFIVESTVTSTGFFIKSDENDFTNEVFAYDATTEGGKDRLEVTFTKGVNVAGPDNLTSVYNWTLNGTQLSKLSNVESIKVEDVNANTKDGYEKVIITFADDRAFGNKSNVVSVTKGITSLDGTVLSGEFEVVAETISDVTPEPEPQPEPTELETALEAVQTAVEALPALEEITAETAEADQAAVDAAQAAIDAAKEKGATEEDVKAAQEAVDAAQEAINEATEEEEGTTVKVSDLVDINDTSVVVGVTTAGPYSVYVKLADLQAKFPEATVTEESVVTFTYGDVVVTGEYIGGNEFEFYVAKATSTAQVAEGIVSVK